MRFFTCARARAPRRYNRVNARGDRRIAVAGTRVPLGACSSDIRSVFECVARRVRTHRGPAAPPPVANQCVLPSPPVDGRNTRYPARYVTRNLNIYITLLLLIIITHCETACYPPSTGIALCAFWFRKDKKKKSRHGARTEAAAVAKPDVPQLPARR